MSIPCALTVKTGDFQAMTEYPERGTFDLQGKEQKIPRGRGGKGFFHGEWYSQHTAENSKAYTVNMVVGGCGGEKPALDLKDRMGGTVLCDALGHRENLK